MTDWTTQSVFFCPETTQKLPENEPRLSDKSVLMSMILAEPFYSFRIIFHLASFIVPFQREKRVFCSRQMHIYGVFVKITVWQFYYLNIFA